MRGREKSEYCIDDYRYAIKTFEPDTTVLINLSQYDLRYIHFVFLKPYVFCICLRSPFLITLLMHSQVPSQPEYRARKIQPHWNVLSDKECR